MKYKYLNSDEVYTDEQPASLDFLYHTVVGRVCLKVVTTHFVSKCARCVMNSRVSKKQIKKYIVKYDVDMSQFDKDKYKSFNEFFKRKLKESNFSQDENSFISTANSKVSCYKISNDLKINVKNSTYTVKELIRNKDIAEEYEGGMCIVYRLSPENYHRYIYVDNGTVKHIASIKGKLHTVNPIVYDKYKVFTENHREVSELETKNFGKIIQIEVGALCIGKIVNFAKEQYERGDEKGYFEFGGSTIIQLIKKEKVKINPIIIENSKENIETYVQIGEKIGEKIK